MNLEPSSWWTRGLNLFGAVAVCYYFTRLVPDDLPLWIAVSGYLGIAAWVALTFAPRRLLAVTGAFTALMVVAGALATLPSQGLMVVLPAVAVLRSVADLRRPLWQGITAWLVGAAVLASGVFVISLPPLAILSLEGGLLVAVFAGYGRRQFREREVLARARAAERAHLLAQEQRQAVARDIHDVLAHSLGGLVIQLDAAGALLDAGRIGDAAERLSDARALAVSGLVEARHAVEALREELPADEGSDSTDLPAVIDDLVRAHRALGGTISLGVRGDSRRLTASESTALAHTLREALTNARKHAPGAPVFVTVSWEPASVSVEVENALVGAVVAVPGGGHGIRGMRERFARIPGAGVTAGASGDRFVVLATVATEPS